MPHWGNGWGMGWGYMWFWWIVALVIIALVVWLVARTMRPGADRTTLHREEETPEQILKKRYARGEIDDEEYHRRLEKLRA